ncbi:MAG TPA: hypothetical protein VMV19_06465 [Xanthobacteraceae bacterium]|nr:hypothetical protein [Xanthobacteraceae bacterium]
MRNLIAYGALAVALAAGVSAAQAQTVDTVIAPQPAPVVIAPAPVETVRTVHTVQSTTTVPRHVVRRHNRVTTTRTTTVTQRILPAPVAPAIVTEPAYSQVMQTPYPRLYDVATPPGIAAAIAAPAPTYRYVYEPDRILVIDPYTNIAVQAIPR